MKPLPARDHADYRWIDPRPGAQSFSCGSCHEAIFDEWAGSAHGGKSRFGARFADLEREYPDGAGVCASCHDPAPLGDERERSGHVHCDFCHKVAAANDGEIGLTHGRFGLQLLRPARGQLVFGPRDDSPRSENSFSPFQRDSRLCASCHEGVVFGVRVYETYSEWRASPAGRAGTQCQECHMKPTGRMANLAPGHGGIERDAKTVANHQFFDGSQLDMLRREVNLTLETTRDESAVRAIIDVRAGNVGHRVPTGSPDRNLTLLVEAFDADGRPLASTGGPRLPTFVGEESRAGRVFAKVLRDWQGHRPVPFWRASPEFDDTRLSPGATERTEFVYPREAVRVTAKLVYRRFWPDLSRAKGWKDDAVIVAEESRITR